MHKENGKWFKTLNFTANWLKLVQLKWNFLEEKYVKSDTNLERVNVRVE